MTNYNNTCVMEDRDSFPIDKHKMARVNYTIFILL